MLKSTEYAKLLKAFIEEIIDDKKASLKIKYKIYIRLDFSIEARLFVGRKDAQSPEVPEFLTEDGEDQLQEKFKEYLKKATEGENEYWNSSLLNNAEKEVFIPEVRFLLDSYEEADSPLNKYMFENGRGNDIEYGAKYRFASLLDQPSETVPTAKKKEVKVITFYSYKGGMGRTTTLIAFALYLASKGKRVAVVDCDLEAPGYLNFFDLSNQIELKEGKRNGLVEYLSDYAFVEGEDEYLDIAKYVVIPTENSQGGKGADYFRNIYIVPGGNLNEPLKDTDSEDPDYLSRLEDLKDASKDYLEGISRLNLSNTDDMMRGFNSLFSKLRQEYQVDVILLDSRTGLNDIFGVLALNMSDYVVGFFGFSDQNMPGLRQLMSAYAHSPRDFKLSLVTTLLPPDATDVWITNGRKKIVKVVDEELEKVPGESEKAPKDSPEHFILKRIPKLEMLGTNDKDADAGLFTLVEGLSKTGEENSIKDIGEMKDLFDLIMDTEWPPKEEISSLVSAYDKNISATDVNVQNKKVLTPIQRQKFILKHVMQQLSRIQSYAEDTSIEPSLFFYRKCMADFFEASKFIIRGPKGAGKSMLYKALGEPGLEATQKLIIKCVKETQPSLFQKKEYICLNAISLSRDISFNELFVKGTVDINIFWMVYTWNVILLDKRFEQVRKNSPIGNKIITAKGFGALRDIELLIANYDFTFLAQVEDDLNTVDKFLREQSKQLFVLYDGLDNIQPDTWSKTVSPLIDFWRDRVESYSNISPKIFMRTDLFGYIRGTNTLRLKETCIDIDWTLEEVFGFFFKLVLSSEEVKAQMWNILKEVNKEIHIQTIENNWDVDAGQMLNPEEAVLRPLVDIFFGRFVFLNNRKVDTWKFFEQNISNASGIISLRPFINLLGVDMLKQAYEDPKLDYPSIILPSKYYATLENRDEAANDYFRDMTRNSEFTDVINFRDYLTSSAGTPYQYKELEEKSFEELLQRVCDTYKGVQDFHSENITQLSQQLIAAGIITMIPRGYKLYRFAPMFHYLWRLKTPEKWERGTLSRGRTGKLIIITREGKRISFVSDVEYPMDDFCGKQIEYKSEEVAGDEKVVSWRPIRKATPPKTCE